MLPLGVLLATGCTSVRVTRLDHCVLQTTERFGNVKEEILFCESEPPTWSSDRSVRLAQECLYHDVLSRRDQLINAQRDGQKPATSVTGGEVFSQCYPEAIRTVQGENDLLKDRAARTDEARVRAESSHARLEEGLTKALDRPINAVADAKATSGSGSDVKHNAELTRTDVDVRQPREQVTKVEISTPPAPRPKPVAKKVSPPAPAPTQEKACVNPCAATPASTTTPPTP
jgi:hypothetical protein